MILLSLVGEQPIPNLIPLWQAPQQYSAARFAATSETREIAKNLAKTIRNDPLLSHITPNPVLELDAYDINTTRSRLAKALAAYQENNSSVCLNLTGGTKIMSLAALLAAFGTGVPLLYVSTQNNSIIYYQSDGNETHRQEISIKIDVKQYFNAHNLEVSSHPNFNLNAAKPLVHPPKEGDDLEKKVFQLARDSGKFDDVQRNIFIRRRIKQNWVRNELDIVVTRNGRLAVCSCKSGDITKEDIYELASLSRREAAGIYCGKVLVCGRKEIPEALRDRARASQVRLVYGSEVENVAEHLLSAISKI